MAYLPWFVVSQRPFNICNSLQNCETTVFISLWTGLGDWFLKLIVTWMRLPVNADVPLKSMHSNIHWRASLTCWPEAKIYKKFTLLGLYLQTHIYSADPKFSQHENRLWSTNHKGSECAELRHYYIIVIIPHEVFRYLFKSIIYCS